MLFFRKSRGNSLSLRSILIVSCVFCTLINFLPGLLIKTSALGNSEPLLLKNFTSLSGKDSLTDIHKTFKIDKNFKATVIVFLSVNCPCSRSHEPILNFLAQKYMPLGFQFVGVHSNANESYEMASSHFKTTKLNFPMIHDPGSLIADQLGAYKTPHVFVINGNHEVLFQGGVDSHSVLEKVTQKTQSVKDYLEDPKTNHFLKNALESIHTNVPIKKSNVRVLGCVIKRP